MIQRNGGKPPDILVLADRGQRIYEERFQAEYERKYRGKFAAIDVDTGEAHLGDSPDEAYLRGLQVSLAAFLYLVRIGYPTAFEFKGRYPYACGLRVS
jgi:hypothetical protein